jgi:hypothetical protein
MEAGYGFRKVAWKKARRALLPALPLEVVRVRVARAKRLGLPYSTYATIRATSGHDIVAFLFSGNALELSPARIAPPVTARDRLRDLDGAAERLAAIYAPLPAAAVLRACPEIDAGVRAPDILTPWGETRARLRGLMAERGLPPDGVVLVSATALEREWCGAAGLAGTVAAEAFFAPAE